MGGKGDKSALLLSIHHNRCVQTICRSKEIFAASVERKEQKEKSRAFYPVRNRNLTVIIILDEIKDRWYQPLANKYVHDKCSDSSYNECWHLKDPF